ncbi:uncharacterized protein BJ171DRAFT_489184 [Polychytrium aggregatum]|uniref:uncharacterized protein n=1 Tax=Polychytrium aggregatum TaxID=110093 RepID=UPI0022FE34C6|nr:uncharacterized protein BJ171DRAFT_489184 [Polychytrium aggregatum]KAI9208523.1 hypothetical protein BJ171DRAFT_489184 [Polychytrium aggregatum]
MKSLSLLGLYVLGLLLALVALCCASDQDAIPPSDAVGPVHDQDVATRLYLAALETLRPLEPPPPSASSGTHKDSKAANGLLTSIYTKPGYHSDRLGLLLPEGLTDPQSIDDLVRASGLQEPLASKQRALLQLQWSARSGSADACLTVADTYLYGKYGIKANSTIAYRYYSLLGHHYGNATGQRMLGLMHATGMGQPSWAKEKERYAKAQLYMSFAAIGGDKLADQVLGYWHLIGAGTPKNCSEAAWYYERVAGRALETFLDGPPLGRTLPPYKDFIPEGEGGIYGVGSMDTFAKNSHSSSEKVDVILQYYKYEADNDNIEAMFHLGQIYYDGHVVTRSYHTAMLYFSKVIKHYKAVIDTYKRNGVSTKDQEKANLSKFAAASAGYIGLMHWRGEGVPQSDKNARAWFEKGATLKSSLCLYALGLMKRDGLAGFEKDLEEAKKLLTEAAKENSGAQYEVGALAMAEDNHVSAFTYLSLSAKKENLRAFFQLGRMYNRGLGVPAADCQLGVGYHKLLSERADWETPIVYEAYQRYEVGDIEGALSRYLIAAELGYEAAQVNAAWIIDRGIYEFEDSGLFPADADPWKVGLVLWSRAANHPAQYNSPARVKAGDYYYLGLGTDTDVRPQPQRKSTHEEPPADETSTKKQIEPASEDSAADDDSNKPRARDAASKIDLLDRFEGQFLDLLASWYRYLVTKPMWMNKRGRPDYQRAALYYQVAADIEASSVAMFNLGRMYECGIGVEKDYHLAKRYYDRAMDTNPHAYLPATLALMKLRLKMLWAAFFDPTMVERPREPEAPPVQEVAPKVEIFDFDLGDGAVDDNEQGHAGFSFVVDAESLILMALSAVAAFLFYYRAVLGLRAIDQARRPPQGQ